MDFFASQDRARRQTKWLVFYFVLAVLGVSAAIYALVVLAAHYVHFDQMLGGQSDTVDALFPRGSEWWHPDWLLMSLAGTVGVIALGSLVKTIQLSAGGGAVARELGGRLLEMNTSDPQERKVLNVIEEMALASGVPMPEVYLLDREEGINAFAAGKTMDDAAIGVTRGCVEQLSRDEFQGVMAHEFSHILNGDMRINLRLMGIIFGIFMIAIIGRTFLRSLWYRPRRSSKDGDKGAIVIILLGFALVAIGWIGVFFGRLIQSAISRQREFLADASAVQFTRNPEGIAGALKKIGGYVGGSRVRHPKAEEARHLFFGEGLGLHGLFSTHPPLEKRIKAIEPQWDRERERKGVAALSSRTSGAEGRVTGFAGDTAAPAPMSAAAVIESVGQLTAEHLIYAQQLRESIAEEQWQRAHDPKCAADLALGLLWREDDRSLSEVLGEEIDEGRAQGIAKAARDLADYSSAQKLALFEVALSGLKSLEEEVIEQLLRWASRLIAADEKVDLWEWTLQKLLEHHLRPSRDHGAVRARRLEEIAGELEVILSALARLGSVEDEVQKAAFEAGAQWVNAEGGVSLALRDGSSFSLEAIDRAVESAAHAAPLVKKRVLRAAVEVVMADGELRDAEAELVRALAAVLDCPIPPLLSHEG